MKITSKIIMLIIAVSIVIILAGNWIFGIFFKGYLIEQENNQIKTNVLNMNSNLREAQLKYEAIAMDWGHWDETYNFVNENDTQYEKLNLNAESMINIKTNLMVFMNKENAVIHKIYFDLEKETFAAFPDSLIAKIEEIKNKAQNKELANIINDGDKFYIISSTEITDSLREKTAGGTFFVGRLIDSSMVEDLQKITNSKIMFLSKDNNISNGFSDGLKIENISYFALNNEKKNEATTYILLPNLDNSYSSVVAAVTNTRSIYALGTLRLGYIQLVYSLFVILIILLLLWFLRAYVIGPLNKLSAALNNINFTENKFERLPVNKNKGLSSIFNAINNMFHRIETEQENLIKSERRSKMAQAMAGAGNWELDLKTNKIWGSEQSFLIYGIENNETGELPLDLVQSCVQPEYRQELDESLKGIIRGEGVYDAEFKINRIADGEERFINSKAELVCDEEGKPARVLGVIYDITKQKQIYESLVDSEIKQKTMIENISDVIAIMAADGTVKYISSNVTKHFGWLPEDIVHTNGWERVHPDDVQPLKEDFKKLVEKDGEAKTIQYRFLCKDGNYKYIELTGKNLLNDKTIKGFLMNYHDITERKENEELMLYNSYHDSLTGLYNRRFFDEEIERIDKEKITPTTIIVGDLNGLKLANDAYGHASGDTLLKKIAEIISSEFGNKGCVARVGGDEFGIILPNINYDEAYGIIRNIKKTCEKESRNELILAISFGIATNKDEKLDLNECYNLAEDRMYTSKLLEGKSAKSKVIDNLRVVLEERTGETQKHCERIAEMSQIIGSEIGLLGFEIEHLKLLALLHDIGKTAIPDSILLKPGRLDEDETAIMKKHCEIGFRIANTMPELLPIGEGILYHHERWDGTGYPMGLKGEEIPKISRIISLLDAYDAMTNDRPYKQSVSSGEAIEEIKRCSGTQFDPDLAKIFIVKVLSSKWK